MKQLAIVALVAACSGDIGATPDAATGASPDAQGTNPAVARGEEWVAAKVPYCQAINHAPDHDSACASICTRPDNPAWDPYRSDCSGFVSWAWGLPPVGGGRTTAGFAPFQTDVSHAIAAAELAPGDAVNNDTHAMLFKAWITPGTMAVFMDEPGCSSATPYAHELTASVTISGQSITVQYRGTYTAIRAGR